MPSRTKPIKSRPVLTPQPAKTVSPAPKPKGAGPWIAALLLFAPVFWLTLQPTLRMARLWISGDSYKKYPLSFEVDGVKAQWGYAGWSGAFTGQLLHFFHLSYREPTMAEASQPPLPGHNIEGGVLKIGGTAFPAGIGTHAPSKIAFDLGGKINRFSCLVGLDQVSPNSAGVVYSVLADGREIFRSPKLRSDADPLPIDVSVAGAKELVLFADNCEFGDMGSSVDWVDLKFNK